MHKYQPRIHLILWRGKESQNLANAPVSLLEQEAHKTFIFSETIFTAVTAYQNHSVSTRTRPRTPRARLGQLLANNLTNHLARNRTAIDHKAQDRLEPLCQGIPRLDSTDRLGAVSLSA